MKKINWDSIWGYYLPVSSFSEKSQVLFLRWGWKNVGGTHVWEKSQIWEKTCRWVWVWENIHLVAQFGEKNSNFLRNLRFEKISALVAPRPDVKLSQIRNYMYCTNPKLKNFSSIFCLIKIKFMIIMCNKENKHVFFFRSHNQILKNCYQFKESETV